VVALQFVRGLDSPMKNSKTEFLIDITSHKNGEVIRAKRVDINNLAKLINEISKNKIDEKEFIKSIKEFINA
jgi:hypothetical protein